MEFIKESLDKLIRGAADSLDAYLLKVCRDESIDDTKAEMHIYMLRLDGNNRPRVSDLASFMSYCIVRDLNLQKPQKCSTSQECPKRQHLWAF